MEFDRTKGRRARHDLRYLTRSCQHDDELVDGSWSPSEVLGDALPLTAAQVETQRAKGLIPNGLQLYVSLGRRVVADVGMGRARPGTAMTNRSICKQYCAIKPVTALAVAELVARRQVALDQPLAHFVPEFGRNGKDRVTLRHVLTHTSGLAEAYHRDRPNRPARLLAEICDSWLYPGWVPGSRAAYSELFGWQLLGRVLEVVLGVALSPYLRAQVLEPCGLADGWVGMSRQDYGRVRHRLAVSYVSYTERPRHIGKLDLPTVDSTEEGEPVGPLWYELTEQSCTETLPALGGYAPARDLGHFYEALVTPEESPVGDLVTPDVLAAFTSVQRSGMFDAVLGRVCDYGLGFMVDLRGHRFGDYCSVGSYGHSGFLGASLAMADPAFDLVVALVCNDIVTSEASNIRRVAIVNAIYEDLGLVDRFSAL